MNRNTTRLCYRTEREVVAQGASAACERMGTKIAEPLSLSANPSSQGCPGARHFASHQTCTP